MIIKSAELFSYHIPLKQPLLFYGKSLSSREGYLIKLVDEYGAAGWGEAAPLPGCHKETLSDVHEQLKNLVHLLRNQSFHEPIEDMRKIRVAGVPLTQYLPTVQWAVETALLTLKANSQGIPLAQLMDPDYGNVVPVNGFLTGSLPDLKAQAQSMIDQGYKAVKLKVGQRTLQEDVERVQAVNHVIESKALLRIDANRSWQLQEAVDFIRQVGLKTIEYIEEPLKDISQVNEFYQETYMPVAVDESVHALDFKTIQSMDGIEILVVKPSVFGSYRKIWDVVQNAKARGLSVVFNSAFESGYGLTVIAHIAACLSKKVPAGLDTGKFYQQDLLKDRLNVSHAKILLDQYPLLNIRFHEDSLVKCDV